MSRIAGLLVSLASLTLVSCSADDAPTRAAGAGSASTTTAAAPGLKVGDAAPDAELLTPDGGTVRLADLYADGPVVVIFYRGGWCPYCTTHLKAWAGKVDELAAAGGTLVAISPERPEEMNETVERNAVPFTLLCDPDQAAARAFRVVFALDDRTQRRYKGFGVDLEKVNASGTWELPAPGAFVVDRSGVIRFADADWDYKQRADPAEVIGAVKALQ